MSTKKFNDSGKIYRFKVMQFDVWEQWGVPRPGAERPFGNPSATAKACHLPHRGRQGEFRACGRGERIPTPVTSVTGSE